MKKTGRAFRSRAPSADDGVRRIYGVHAVEAALSNPRREIKAVYATPNAAQRIEFAIRRSGLAIRTVTPKELDRMLGGETVHQGVMLEAAPLAQPTLDELASARLLLVLDQVTDPHNVGAILRSAAAFGVDALIMTARHSPPLEGALAKAASGALDHVPVVLAPNLARALGELGESGFLRIGLDSGADAALEEMDPGERLALVLGAEDRGLRRLTSELCDHLCAIRTFGPIGSLNVSNAAAIALHTMAHRLRRRPDPLGAGIAG